MSMDFREDDEDAILSQYRKNTSDHLLTAESPLKKNQEKNPKLNIKIIILYYIEKYN